MIDNYPTRKREYGSFMPRLEHVSYGIAPEGYTENGYAVIRDFFSKGEILQCLNGEPAGLITKDPLTGGRRSVTGIHDQEP